MAKKTDITYADGFIRGRAAIDCADEEGNLELEPGLAIRVRVDRVDQYCANRPGVVDVYVIGRKEPFTLIGTMSALDATIARHRAMRAASVDMDAAN